MKSLRQIKPYVAGAQPQDKKMIKINTNENAFPPSPGVLKALASFDGQSLRQYSSLVNAIVIMRHLHQRQYPDVFLHKPHQHLKPSQPH